MLTCHLLSGFFVVIMLALLSLFVGLDRFLVLVFWDVVVGLLAFMSGTLTLVLFFLSIDLVV